MTFGKSKGPAGEYWDTFCNFLSYPGGGCLHGCKYCWSIRMMGMHGARWEPNRCPRLIDWPDKIPARVAAYTAKEGSPREVVLCNTSDCYAAGLSPEIREVRRKTIKIFDELNIPVCILSKSALAVEDLDLLAGVQCRVGMTVTTLDGAELRYWEPYASVPELRLEVLEKAHDRGIRTWISCEPVLDMESPLQILREAADYADEVWFGRLNYHSPRHDVDLDRLRSSLMALASATGVPIKFKKGFAGRQKGSTSAEQGRE